VFRVRLSFLLCLFLSLFPFLPLASQDSSDPVAQALSQGDLYQSKRKYELALDAYHKADKLSHHSSAACYLKIASVERKLGDFSSALDDAKRSVKAAGDNKPLVVQGHLFRATLLAQMAGKPTDKKLRESEEEIRQALAVDSSTAIAHYDLGFVLLKQERDPEGIAELNTYISLLGVDPSAVTEARRYIANPIRARAPFAPDFSFTTLEHQGLSNASLRGKVVLMDFWGTWCPPCRESVPILRDLNKKYSSKPFQLVGVSSDDDEDVWKTFVSAQHMDWSEYIDLSGDVLEAFKIESFPTYVVLDKDSVIRFRQSGLGPDTRMELEEAIGKALKRESDPKLAAAAAAEAGAGAAPKGAPSAASSGPVAAAGTNAAADASQSVGSAKANNGPTASFHGIEAATISGNVYKNESLRITFSFPQGWIAATPEFLHELNERTEATAKAAILKQHPELANSLVMPNPRAVFYASRKGEWDGQHLAIPSMRIDASPSKLDSVSLEYFQKLVERMAAAPNMKVTFGPSEYRVKEHPFVHADFVRTVGVLQIYESLTQTIAGGSLLSIEIFASSADELQQAAASLQTMSISNPKP